MVNIHSCMRACVRALVGEPEGHTKAVVQRQLHGALLDPLSAVNLDCSAALVRFQRMAHVDANRPVLPPDGEKHPRAWRVYVRVGRARIVSAQN
jgi:hypothetical protein